MRIKYSKGSIFLSRAKLTPVGILLYYDKDKYDRRAAVLVDNVVPYYIKILEKRGDKYVTKMKFKFLTSLRMVWRTKTSIEYDRVIQLLGREYKKLKRFQWFFYLAYYFVREARENSGFIDSIASWNLYEEVWWIKKAIEDGKKEIRMINNKYVYKNPSFDKGRDKDLIYSIEKFLDLQLEVNVAIRGTKGNTFYYNIFFKTKDGKYKVMVSFVSLSIVRKYVLDELFSGLYMTNYRVIGNKYIRRRYAFFTHLLWNIDALYGLLKKMNVIKGIVDRGMKSDLRLIKLSKGGLPIWERIYVVPFLYLYGLVVSKERYILRRYGKEYFENLLEDIYEVQRNMIEAVIPSASIVDKIKIKENGRWSSMLLPMLYNYTTFPFIGRSTVVQGVMKDIVDGWKVNSKRKIVDYHYVGWRRIRFDGDIRFIIKGRIKGYRDKYLSLVKGRKFTLYITDNDRVVYKYKGPFMLIEMIELLWKYLGLVWVYPEWSKDRKEEESRRVTRVGKLLYEFIYKEGDVIRIGFTELVDKIIDSLFVRRARFEKEIVYASKVKNVVDKVKMCKDNWKDCREWWGQNINSSNMVLLEDVLFIGKVEDFMMEKNTFIKGTGGYRKVSGADILYVIKRNREDYMVRLLLYSLGKSIGMGMWGKVDIKYGIELNKILEDLGRNSVI